MKCPDCVYQMVLEKIDKKTILLGVLKNTSVYYRYKCYQCGAKVSIKGNYGKETELKGPTERKAPKLEKMLLEKFGAHTFTIRELILPTVRDWLTEWQQFFINKDYKVVVTVLLEDLKIGKP